MVPTRSEQWSGTLLLSSAEVDSLREKAGRRSMQAHVDRYLQQQQEEPEDWREI
jgi:hypothetical protein